MRRLVILSLLGAACGDLELDLSSEGTAVTATAGGDGTIEVLICAGPRELLSCNEAPRFTVSMGAQVVGEEQVAPRLFGERVALLDEDPPGQTVVVRRAADGAEMSVALPPPFALTAPADGAMVSRAAGVTLRWTPAHDDTAWKTVTTCGAAVTAQVGDAGRDAVTLRGDAFPEVGAGVACEVEVTIEHRRSGEVGRGYPPGSHIRGVQARTVRLRLTP
jgi:hypothetical protein